MLLSVLAVTRIHSKRGDKDRERGGGGGGGGEREIERERERERERGGAGGGEAGVSSDACLYVCLELYFSSCQSLRKRQSQVNSARANVLQCSGHRLHLLRCMTLLLIILMYLSLQCSSHRAVQYASHSSVCLCLCLCLCLCPSLLPIVWCVIVS